MKIFKLKNLWILAGVIFSLSLANTASASVIPKPANNLGLVGYWSMEDTTGSKATDFSGNGNTGTISGASWATGKVGTGLSFDGNDDISVPDANSLDLSTAGTVSFWYKQSSSGQNMAVGKWLNTGNQQSYLLQHFTDNKIYWNLSPNGSTDTYLVSDNTYTDTNWHHVVGTYDASGSVMALYLDGTAIANTRSCVGGGCSTSIPSSLYNSTTPITTTYNGSQYNNGTLDDVRIYNRALSATEISTLYTNSVRRIANKSVNKNGLVGYWSMEDATSTKATDFSGQGNTGTLTNMESTDWVAGKIGTGLSFDGTNEYVNLGTNVGNFANTEPFSVSVWVYARTLDSNVRGVVARMQGTSPYNGWSMATRNGGFIRFGPSTNDANYSYVDTPTLQTGRWYHIVGTYDGGGTGGNSRIWVNGVESALPLKGGSLGTTTNDQPLTMGSATTSSWFFDGIIDDLRIYNRALSATEISVLYNNSKITKLNSSQNSKSTDGLVGMWSFNGPDLTTTTATDVSVNNNHGTLSGPTPTAGKVGQALSFGGDGDSVSFGSSNDLNLPSALSIGIWFKQTGTPGGSVTPYHGLVQRFGAGITGYQLYLSGANVLRFYTSTDLASTYTLADNDWHYYLVTNDGTTTRFYVDGVARGSGSQTVPSITSAVTYHIGKFDIYGYTNGLIDEVRIYNRALTAAEVLSLYNQGR